MPNDKAGKEEWRAISTNSVVKSYGNMPNFMACHGLKDYNSEDYDTARSIINTMKENQWNEMSASQKADARAHQAKYKY
jgi:hypothetical protein